MYCQPFNFTLDFEDGDLRGWVLDNTDTNNAFFFQPTFGDNPTARQRGQPSNHQGLYWIGTYERYQGNRMHRPGNVQGDLPVGTLTSPVFTIPGGTLSFLIGGGSSFETRVELVILDPMNQSEERVFYATGRNHETMQRVTWDLNEFKGRRGRIRIVDASRSGWGHINADDFQFIPAAFQEEGTEDDKKFVPDKHFPPSFRPWLILVIILTIAVLGYYFLSHRKRPVRSSGEMQGNIQITPYPDIGFQQIDPETPVKPVLEIRLMPVIDPGKQNLIAEKEMITNERRETSDGK